jgi:hypothetical protein
MSIIIISSDAYSVGRDIAVKTAEVMQYDFLGRESLAEVAQKYDIEETKLITALDQGPSFLGMKKKFQSRCLAYIQEATLGALLKDKTVCHGLAAHLYVLGISHVLNVLILADPNRSFRESGSKKDAKKLIERRNSLRRRWSMDAFGLDETDPSQYDLTISLSQIDADEAVKIIIETITYRRFNPMTYSVKCLQDLELAARVRTSLLADFPDFERTGARRNRGGGNRGPQTGKTEKSRGHQDRGGKNPGCGIRGGSR